MTQDTALALNEAILVISEATGAFSKHPLKPEVRRMLTEVAVDLYLRYAHADPALAEQISKHLYQRHEDLETVSVDTSSRLLGEMRKLERRGFYPFESSAVLRRLEIRHEGFKAGS